MTWQEFGADTPRFVGARRALRLEGQRTNALRNPRWDGGVAGSPGTLPTNVTRTGGTGVTQTLAFGTAQGLPCMDMAMVGTTASTNSIYLFEAAGIIPAAPGDILSVSMLMALVGGNLTNITGIQMRWTWADASDVGISSGNGADIKGSLTTGLLKCFDVTSAAPALTASVRLGLLISYSSGVAIDATLRLAAPQVEAAPFPSTPILPAVGTPAASTRGADLVSATLASLGIGANGACTLLMTAMLDDSGGAALQALLAMDDGSVANRWLLYQPGGATSLRLLRSTASVSDFANSGTITSGVWFKLGLSIDGTGNGFMCVDGAAAVQVTGGPTSSLATLRIGNQFGAGAPMFGEVQNLSLLPYAMTGAELQAAVAALP